MPTVRYSQFTGQWWEQASLEDLLSDLADFLLQSGLGESDPWGEPADDLTRLKEALHSLLLQPALARRKPPFSR